MSFNKTAYAVIGAGCGDEDKGLVIDLLGNSHGETAETFRFL